MRTLFYSLRLAGLLAVAAGAVSSCLNPPDYSDTPSISNPQIFYKRLASKSGTSDSIAITVSYQDGNGDLGLADGDTAGVYAYRGGNNRNNNNYFLQPYIKDGQGNFQPYINPNPKLNYNGRFPRITADGTKAAPVKGTLVFGKDYIPGYPFRPHQEVRFVVSIQDRALHESNVVTTNSIIIP
ncbi:hypothetical protein [Hymenobacter nivis]|uniref:DUF3823 domain-containing protein n=1 Tax=Hymenobacter nivis TaxID=1850093 RepID=A0A2Z3GLI4_9BACT|nr:hypothetical protein [Hymenobacter nivis]AWM31765.1 hypothetical protein DDQ68_02585 [Hymenobacter nivis]